MKRSARLRPLSPRQAEVLAFLEDFIGAHGFPPSSRELSQACRLGSPSGAHRMLLALERKGYLARQPRLSRAAALMAPQLVPGDLDAEDLSLVASLVKSQALACECSLVMASRMEDLDIKGKLIRGAWERHRLAVHWQAALSNLDEALSGSARDIVTRLAALRRDTSWPIFVVDQLICDRSSAIVAGELAKDGPALNVIFSRVARFCSRAAGEFEEWLVELAERMTPSEREVLRARVAVMLDVCEVAARALERRGPRYERHFTALLTVPESLQPSPLR